MAARFGRRTAHRRALGGRRVGARIGATVTTSLAQVRNLTVSYRGRPAISAVTGSFTTGSLTAVYGPNGAGKSTLLAALAGRLAAADGSIDLPAAVRARTAFLPQRAELDRTFPIRVGDVVAMGHWARAGAFGQVDHVQRRATADALHRVGMSGLADRLIGEVSVGQMQRALFARVILQDAPLILLDEPFAAVDTTTTADLLGVIRQWHAERRTVVAVLHDVAQVRAHFPQTLLLARKMLAWGATTDVVTAANLTQLRTMAEGWTLAGDDWREAVAI